MAMLVPMGKESADDLAFGYRVGKNIQAILRAKGLSQGQLSYMTGMPTSAISQLVNGRKNPSLLSVRQIAMALNVSLDELAELKPLQIPQVAPTEKDRLSALEEQVARLAEVLAPALDMTAEALREKVRAPESQPKRAGTRQPRSREQQRPA